MWALILLFILVVLCVVGYLFLRKAGGGRFPWLQFYLKGKESGFAFKEVNLLRKISVENRMREPTSLFWSIKQLDRCIKGTIISFRARGAENSPESTMVISKLYDFRKKVEFDQPRYNLGIKSSRDIVKRQRIRVSLPNLGPFASMVVDNLRRYVAISYPKGPDLPQGFNWKGQQISVSFWREGDAGYFFQTKVVGDYSGEQNYPILHVAQSENLVRTQKRRSVRAEVNTEAQIFPLKSVDQATDEIEPGRGLKSLLMDISEDGAALLIGGRAKVGLPMKFQFALTDQTIAMSGIVKRANFDQKKNRSILHIQGLPISNVAKNAIRSYVYDIFGDQRRRKSSKKKPVKN